MKRRCLAATAAVLLCLALGCGSDDDQVAAPLDLAVPSVDLPMTSGSCGAGDVQSACGGTCAACLLLGATGLCVTPCATAQPSCPTGQTCHPAAASDDGGTAFGSVQFGGACGGFDGYCS